jgi:hypothetical protein
VGFPPRVEGDTGAPIFFDFLNDGGPVLFSEIPFPSTRRGPELETGVKEEVVTKLRVTEDSIEVQLLESLAIDEGNKRRCRDAGDVDNRY